MRSINVRWNELPSSSSRAPCHTSVSAFHSFRSEGSARTVADRDDPAQQHGAVLLVGTVR